MSCRDCDWGCTVAECGQRMSVCENHYDAALTELRKLQNLLALRGPYRGNPGCSDCMTMSHCETHEKAEGVYPFDDVS